MYYTIRERENVDLSSDVSKFIIKNLFFYFYPCYLNVYNIIFYF